MMLVDSIKIEQGYLAIKKNGQWIDQECIYKNGRCGLTCPVFYILEESDFAVQERDRAGIYLGCLREYITCYKENFMQVWS